MSQFSLGRYGGWLNQNAVTVPICFYSIVDNVLFHCSVNLATDLNGNNNFARLFYLLMVQPPVLYGIRTPVYSKPA